MTEEEKTILLTRHDGLLQRQGIGRQPGSFALSPPRNAPAPCTKAKNLLYYNEFAPKGRKW